MKENKNKNLHGAKGIETLDNMVNALYERGYITLYKKNYSIAEPGYPNKQFKFQYIIGFQNNEQWILHHTTSIRDRINCQQWHSEHIKLLNRNVKRAYIVVPDDLSEEEKHKASNYNKNIVNKKIYSAIDGVLPFGIIYTMIERKAALLLSRGKAHASLGLHFETKLTYTMRDQQNFDRWKYNPETSVGYLYPLFLDIVNKLCLDKEKVIAIDATSDISKLPSGGSPKTDVLLYIKTENGIETHTFSCKRSSSSWVSVHEYTADAFADVLNPADNRLRELLYTFQQAGGARGMGEEKAEEMLICMEKYLVQLSRWVIGGVGGEGDSSTQWAEYIITLDERNNHYSIHTVDEYIEECIRQNVKGQFGTLFRWTYPSGGKGKRIQLKGKIV
ncbi:MAG: MspI family type II restriction endonuclease [Lachnospiraceae bacterium]|jgi:Restriction endonuclease MspI.|nr:MspI family type II restriction endonuclease [Lachnospiraceae bacterium]